METYTKTEAVKLFGAQVVKRLDGMERKAVKNMVGGRGYDFFDEYYTDYVDVKGGRIRGCYFQPKDGSPMREYVELIKNEKVYCVVEHTDNGYIVHHVYFKEKNAYEMKVFCQGMAPSTLWDVKTFDING